MNSVKRRPWPECQEARITQFLTHKSTHLSKEQGNIVLLFQWRQIHIRVSGQDAKPEMEGK